MCRMRYRLLGRGQGVCIKDMVRARDMGGDVQDGERVGLPVLSPAFLLFGARLDLCEGCTGRGPRYLEIS